MDDDRATVTVRVRRLTETARLPYRATSGAACYDLYLDTLDMCVIGTGIAMAIPPGYEGLIRPRSGLASRGVVVVPGTIDSDYRGEVRVILRPAPGLASAGLRYGDRIAQIAIRRVPDIEWVEVDGLDETERGEGGLGSTGDR